MIQNKKMVTIINWVVTILLAFIFLSAMTFHTLYEKTIKYSGLLFVMLLVILLFTQVPVFEKLKKKDPETWLLLFSGILVPVNLFLVKSNWGAMFTAWLILLLFYLVKTITIQKECLFFLYAVCLATFFFWMVSPLGDYNKNYIGMTACLLYICFMVVLFYVKSCYPKKYIYEGMHILSFLLTVVIVLENRARTSLLALFLFEILRFLFLKGAGKKKWFTNLIAYGITIGDLVFTLIYMNLYQVIGDAKMPFFNKRIMSGRQYSWRDFWSGFVKRPITGMGSDFEHAITNWSGIEAHNALLSLLAVHGVIVFCVMLFLIIRYLKKKTLNMEINPINAICMAGVFTVFVFSVFENSLYETRCAGMILLFGITYNVNSLNKKGE